ncbi:MAG: HAD-IIIC family phosphatase [Nitrospirae bacterium]|nr:MAG: HAD-IIIC family phosphatase [Nitrospirota bacterium]
MSVPVFKGAIISDFNAGNFEGCLKNSEDLPGVDPVLAPFGQVVPALLQDDFECWRNAPDFAVVWARPQSVIPSFARLLRYETVPADLLLSEVDAYWALLERAGARVKFLFVPTWTAPAHHREFGLLDLKAGVGPAHALMQMNLRLAEHCGKSPNIHLLNSQRWVEAAGRHAFNPKLWYMGKIAFGNDVFIEAAREVKAALRGLTGQSKKLVLVDLDDTLWGGIVGDLGWENIALGGHDAVGEAFADFQRTLKALTRRGVLLGIVSKNDEAVALEALRRHPEMVLRPEDFVGWRINWQDKAENILDLVRSLNLGLQSVVFIDDNPVERDRVREALPEVFVPEWPADTTLYESTLLSLRCFNAASITAEDAQRTRLYAAEGQREDLKRQLGSVEAWLKTLDVRVTVERLQPANLQRTTQLLNKTNQMNLTTRRMSEAELSEWAAGANRRLWTIRVADRFGDSGLTGIVSVESRAGLATIVDFVLSCRVMGRRVEEAMLHLAGEYARSQGARTLHARYVATEKNRPCLEFWQKSGFAAAEGALFSWDLSNPYPRPDTVTIEGKDA